jgi:hypothetical protein
VNFQFTISETQEVSLADVRVKVQNTITRVRYNETAPFQSVGLAFASLPDLSSRENVSIHTLDYYPLANRPGVVTQAYYQIDSFFTEIGKFNITDMFIKKGTGLDVPLYWEHQIPITTDLFIQSGSDIIVLDKNFDPVDPEDYLVWEGSTYWSVFHNFKHEYDGLTGDYTNYYISYPLWDNTRATQREHIELLDPTPRFRAAVEDDYFPDPGSPTLVSLPDDVPLYEVQISGDRFLVNIPYDIVTYSPMNDIYVSPTPYIYAYRPNAIHEIGPLYPAAIHQDDPWFPLLTNGHFLASDNEYLIAEYAQQPFIPYQPYKREIYDETIILERTLIKTQKQNLHVDALNGFHLELLIFDRNENIKWAGSTDTTKEYYVDAVGEFTSIPYEHEGFDSVNSEDGLIQINYSLVELDDVILANYYYIEPYFEYTQVNMNPIYVPDMVGKSVVLYVVPYAAQTITVYHLILDEEDKIKDSNGIPDSVAIPESTNVSHGTVLVGRGYTDSVDAAWYIEITQSNSTPGDITDAQYRYKKSFTGAWGPATSMITGWVTLGSGVQIKFEPGTGGQDFTAGDTWTIEVQSNDIGLTDDIIGMTYDDFLDTYCLPDNTSPGFLIVARYGIGSNRGLQDLQLVDTRVRGGGINPDQLSEAKLAYPDISWMFDIGHYDGAPFPGSAATLIDLPASLLEVNGGIFTREQVDSIVKHHLSFGVYPVVRFYCTNTGLVSHETVPDETYVDNWVVPEDAKCPTPDGEVICQSEFLTTTTSTSTTSSTSSTTSSTSSSTTTSSTASTSSTTASTSSTTSSTTTTSSTSSSSTTTTVTTAMALNDDEFPSLPVEDWWTYQDYTAGGSYTIAGGKLELSSCIDSGSCGISMGDMDILKQGYNFSPTMPGIAVEFDAYTHLNVTLGDMPQPSYVMLAWYRNDEHYAFTELTRKSGGEYRLRSAHRDGNGKQLGAETVLAADDVWLRLKRDAGGNFKHYYALSEPTVELDWTELTIPGSPLVDTNTSFSRVGMIATHCSSGPFVTRWAYFRNWVV